MQLLPLLCALFSAGAADQTTVLRNGHSVERAGIRSYKYWNCADTYLDHAKKDANFGGEQKLSAGPNKRILIRFDDIVRAIGPNKRIVAAKLILSPSGSTPKQIGIFRVLQSWNEGPGREGSRYGTKVPMAATWEYRISKGELTEVPWSAGGCFKADMDRTDKPTVVARPNIAADGTVAISGLEADVQNMVDRPYLNFGWVLDIKEEADFYSSEASVGRPTLEIACTDAQPRAGSDLTITYIERTPEYKRFNPENAYTYKEQRGTPVGIMDRPGNAAAQQWPPDNTLVQYTAHVKNQGSAPVSKWRFEWSINGRVVSGGTGDPVASGAETTLQIPAIWINEHKDHRTRTVSLSIDTDEPEVTKQNNFLRIYTHGLNLGVWVEKSFYDAFRAKTNGVGTNSYEDWLQWQFWIWNEVYLAKSKFYYAPDGALERVRVQRITIVPDGTLDKGGNHVPGGKTDFNYDGEWGFDYNKDKVADVNRYIEDIRAQTEWGLLHECSHQIGLIDIYQMNIDGSLPDGDKGKVRLKAGGKSVITRGCIDPFGGLMGGGDTRNDLFVPSFLSPPNEPTSDPRWQFPLFEPTGLYAGLDIIGLNSNVGFRRGFYGEFLYDLPKLIFLRAMDAAGQKMPGAEIEIYQSNGGEFKDELPVLRGTTDAEGLLRLSNSDTLEPKDFRTMTNHILRPNPFGRIDVVGSNGVFLIQARFQGQEEWQFLKIWELNAALWRGNDPVMTRELRFNICPKAIEPTNVAEGKLVTVPGAPHAPALTDADFKSSFRLPGAGSSVTVDLGAEVEVAEVGLHTYANNGGFWRMFEIQVYTQEAGAGTWAREADWGWAVAHNRDVDPADFRHMVVTYRNAPRKGRYVRIVNKAESAGELSEIVVRAARP